VKRDHVTAGDARRRSGGTHGAAISAVRATTPLFLASIRAQQGLDEVSFAWFLETPVETVLALERGNASGMPPWPELERIAKRWLALSGVDPSPFIAELAVITSEQTTGPARSSGPRIRAPRRVSRLGSGALQKVLQRVGFARSAEGPEPVRQAPKPIRSIRSGFGHLAAFAQRARRPSPDQETPSEAEKPRRDRHRAFGGWVRWAVAVIVLSIISWATGSGTSVVAQAVRELPPAHQAFQSISDFFAVQFAPVRAGHKWIEVSDPHSRRGDKLRIGPRSD